MSAPFKQDGFLRAKKIPVADRKKKKDDTDGEVEWRYLKTNSNFNF